MVFLIIESEGAMGAGPSGRQTPRCPFFRSQAPSIFCPVHIRLPQVGAGLALGLAVIASATSTPSPWQQRTPRKRQLPPACRFSLPTPNTARNPSAYGAQRVVYERSYSFSGAHPDILGSAFEWAVSKSDSPVSAAMMRGAQYLDSPTSP